MYQVEEDNALATSLPALRSKTNTIARPDLQPKNPLDVPLARRNKYCKESVKYQCMRDWNNFKKKFPKIPENKLFNMKMKIILKQAIFNQY